MSPARDTRSLAASLWAQALRSWGAAAEVRKACKPNRKQTPGFSQACILKACLGSNCLNKHAREFGHQRESHELRQSYVPCPLIQVVRCKVPIHPAHPPARGAMRARQWHAKSSHGARGMAKRGHHHWRRGALRELVHWGCPVAVAAADADAAASAQSLLDFLPKALHTRAEQGQLPLLQLLHPFPLVPAQQGQLPFLLHPYLLVSPSCLLCWPQQGPRTWLPPEHLWGSQPVQQMTEGGHSGHSPTNLLCSLASAMPPGHPEGAQCL